MSADSKTTIAVYVRISCGSCFEFGFLGEDIGLTETLACIDKVIKQQFKTTSPFSFGSRDTVKCASWSIEFQKGRHLHLIFSDFFSPWDRANLAI